MTSPNSSAPTSQFSSTGQLNIDALLNEGSTKWGGARGTGTDISFSFPWLNGQGAYWQTQNYSEAKEPTATFHFGLNSYQTGIARQALQAWANIANVHFTETAETAANVGDIRFAFSSAVDEDGAWGWASYPNSDWAAAGDIWISTDIAYESDWSTGTYNYLALMHEIGHAIGLKHPGNYGDGGGGPFLPSGLDDTNYTIMSYNISDDNFYPNFGPQGGPRDSSEFTVYQETPMVLDIAAIQYIYGANMQYRAEDDTYTFDGHTPFFETLWDAGGIDAIDVSAYTLGTTIDLRPGHYSSLYIPPSSDPGGYATTYDGTNALGIAYGCIIENVIGSSGNDTIYENSADNTINGGDGTDTLVLTGHLTDYRITIDPQTEWLQISRLQSSETDRVKGIETFTFADRSITYTQLLADLRGSQTGKTITGTTGADNLVGEGTNDILIGLGGNDAAYGGGGVDTFVLNTSTQDVIDHAKDTIIGYGVISSLSSSLGTVILHDVERVQLNDGLYAFDTQAPSDTAPQGGSVWQAQALYQAIFGHWASITELSRWTAEADRLGGISQLGQAFIDFYAESASTTNLVSYLYTMLTHTAGSTQTVQSLVDQIGTGRTYETQGDFLAWAAQLSLNTVNLVGFTNSIATLDANYF